jgi:hypothetical protein
VEGLDPTGIASSIYSENGLNVNRCSSAFRNGKVTGLIAGLVSGGFGIRSGLKSISTAGNAARRVSLFRTGGNGRHFSGQFFNTAQQLENDVQQAQTAIQQGYGIEAGGRLINDILGGDQNCGCQGN